MGNDDRIVELLEVIAKAAIAPALAAELVDEKMKKLYEITGGVTAEQACKTLKVGKTTVVDAWQRWEQAGILVRDGRKYRKVLES